MHCHRTPHADFGAALSFAVSRVRGLLRTDAPAATRSPHSWLSPQVAAVTRPVTDAVRQLTVGLALVALMGCSFRAGLQNVERGTPVAVVLREFGPPSRNVPATEDGWHREQCPGAVRLHSYSDLTGRVGRLLDSWLNASETVVCVDGNGRVAGTYFVQ